MDCSRIRQAFLDGKPLQRAEVQAHLDSCPECRELYEDGGKVGRALGERARLASAPALPSLPVGEHSFYELEASLARENGPRSWLRSRPTRVRIGLVVAGVILVAAIGGGLRLRFDLPDYPRGRLLLLLGGYVLAAAIAVSLAVRNESSPRPAWQRAFSRRPTLLLVALVIPLLAALAPPTEACRHLGSEGALNCFGYGLLLTGPLALLLWALDRDELPTLGTVTASAVALGFASSSLLELHCPNGNLSHLMLGHASIGFTWFAIWLALRQRALHRDD